MDKERRSITVDPEVNAYLSREGVNASQLINKLVKDHMSAGGDNAALRQIRMQRLEDEYEEAATTAREKLRRYNELKQETDKQREEIVQKAAEKIPKRIRDPDNAAVENWAEKANMDPETLIERMGEVDDE